MVDDFGAAARLSVVGGPTDNRSARQSRAEHRVHRCRSRRHWTRHSSVQGRAL